MILVANQHDRQREAKRAWAASQSQSGRDIGSIPPIADLERRASCRFDLRRFCETYNPAALYYNWSDAHLRAIQRIEEAALRGALFAFAMPRGSGKTTLSRLGVLWAIAYGHARYPFIIGANADKAQESLDAIKTMIRFLSEFAMDFPEISLPVNAMGGIANRASGQICNGRSTLIQWGKDRIVLATVPLPPNWPDDWPQGPDGQAPTSGSLIGCSGLTGDGIRGSLHFTSSGEPLRPDFVLLDDPQTDESAGSPSGNAKRERLVGGAVLGMAGPGKDIAAVMPCTVIQQDDFVDRILDRDRHPLWRGERTQMLNRMPRNMDAWEKYLELYQACAAKEPPDYTESNAYYKKHRATLEEGAEASWEDRKKEWELSAIQHAMHLYCRDEAAFWAEYQNQPQADTVDTDFLTADKIAAKVTSAKQNQLPVGTQHVTAFIDVQHRALYWSLVAWGDAFTGGIIDYGTYPDQKRRYFQYREATRTLGRSHKGMGAGGAIYAGLMALIDNLCSRDWDGIKVSRLLVDAGDGTYKSVIYKVCRDSPHSAVLLPSLGRGIRAGDNPLDEWKRNEGERIGHQWRIRTSQAEKVRYLLFDSNYWKTFIQHRLATAEGDPGSLSLYKATPTHHRMISEHLTAEKPQRTEGRGREVIEWKHPPNKPDNHLLDCVVGSAVAASTVGVTTIEHKSKKKGTKRRKATGAWAK